MHVDAELSKDLRLLAVADLEAGIVGEHGQVQARKLRSTKVRIAQSRPFPVDPVEGTADQRGLAEVGVEGTIIGKALYTRAFTLPEALALIRRG